MFVRPVDGHDDLLAFRYDFAIEGKAADDGTRTETITEAENGDLIIEGYAAVFDGLDRENENFAEGAFQRGIKSFLTGAASLNYHHKHDHGIGKVLALEEHPGKGLWMRARVDYQPESSPFRYIYNGVKKGTYTALSVGGFFKRALTKLGKRIVDMDFTEISITPVPVHPGPSFAVVAGKALDDIKLGEGDPPKDSDVRAEIMEAEDAIREAIAKLDGIFTRIVTKTQKETESEEETDSEENVETPQVVEPAQPVAE